MSHEHAGHIQENRERPVERVDRRPLAIALAITSTFLLVEVAGGLLTNSLALLADAVHMAADVAALGLSFFAIWLADRPATPRRPFGYYRAEVLAALVNAAMLIAITLVIFWEAAHRLDAPPEVDSGPMLAVAIAGLVANAGAAWVLMRGGGHEHNLNVRGAFLHVIGDMLGSLAAVIAAVIMLATGWFLADPLLSIAIGLLILWASVRLLRDSVDVLLEATPRHLDPVEIGRAMRSIDGVMGVHDLHVWTVTSGLVALSSHVEVDGSRDWHDVLLDLAALLRERFGIAHVTLQPEESERLPESLRGCMLDTLKGRQARWAALSTNAKLPPRRAAFARHRRRD